METMREPELKILQKDKRPLCYEKKMKAFNDNLLSFFDTLKCSYRVSLMFYKMSQMLAIKLFLT